VAHLSENNRKLDVKYILIPKPGDLVEEIRGFSGVCLLRLPPCEPSEKAYKLEGIESIVSSVANALGKEATLIILGEPIDLVHIHQGLADSIRYQQWIAIKRSPLIEGGELSALLCNHWGALVHTKYNAPLRHAKTRIKYTYCPACGRTTKDYGGKKHTYHEYGTLISDIWRDIDSELGGDITPIIDRFADFFGIEQYCELRFFDLRPLGLKRIAPPHNIETGKQESYDLPETQESRLILGDCLEELQKLPDNSIDFAFADPPYNLKKKYCGYMDDLAISEYFEWCDKWISELARILRPGRTCAVLNIPLWAIRHFIHMEKILDFQNWIVWEALGFPVRFIMPAHYTILCFSKGKARNLPGLTGEAGVKDIFIPQSFNSLEPLAELFCLRADCIRRRKSLQVNDRGHLTDLWWDIHRLKHNARRVDHPCQLPPQLMYRLISTFTKPGEVVLDCFNGAGTTTLSAHQLDRRYIGIEISEQYHNLAESRHKEIILSLNPFRKAERTLTAKNSPVPRMPKVSYEVPKKTLQLEIKRIAKKLGRLPNRDEVIEHSKYSIRYYDEYFASWGEACAAARTTGMSEYPLDTLEKRKTQLNLFE